MLYVFGGLPGVGKSELAKFLSAHVGAVYLRIDRIEQSLQDQGYGELYDEAYQVAASMALENLTLGLAVVADSTNPVEVSRQLWRSIAAQADIGCIEIEVVCSNQVEHKQRVESRCTDIPNLQLPSWQHVINREYHAWQTERLVIDTAEQTLEQSQQALLKRLSL